MTFVIRNKYQHRHPKTKRMVTMTSYFAGMGSGAFPVRQFVLSAHNAKKYTTEEEAAAEIDRLTTSKTGYTIVSFPLSH